MAGTIDMLERQVSKDLARSGLTLKDVSGAKIVGPEAMMPLPGQGIESDAEGHGDDFEPELTEIEAEGGYSIPYRSLDGTPVMDNGKPFERIRLIDPRNNQVPRYRSPRGSINHVYIPQGLRELLLQLTQQRNIVPGADILIITEGEKKAIRSVLSGMPCIALPGVYMWADSLKVRAKKKALGAIGGPPISLSMSEDTPVNPELLAAINEIRALCPSIGAVVVLFDSDGAPMPLKASFKIIKGERVPKGGIDWHPCPIVGDDQVSANPRVTTAGYLLASALRKQALSHTPVVTRFCMWNKDDEEEWEKQGLDDWLMAEISPGYVAQTLRAGLTKALRLRDLIREESLFTCGVVNPDILGSKAGPSAEIAFSQMLDGKRVGRADGLLYEWVGSHWQTIDRLRLERAAHALMDAFYAENGSARKVNDSPKLAVSAPHLYPIPTPCTQEDVGGALVPCMDVTLEISGEGDIVAREPSKDDGLRHCIDAKWTDRHNSCPLFSQFIESTLPDAAVRALVQQYIGYTLVGDTRHDVAQWWFGSGANGKSVLAEIVGALHRKVASANLEDLGGFQSEGLIDASLITVDETPKRVDEQKLKTAISGGEISINRKFHVPVTVKLSAKWLLRGNEKPALTDQSGGLWRRLHIIHFEQKFEGEDKDPLLLKKILKSEMSGVLNWAIKGLVRLLRAKGFVDVPECVFAWKRDMQTETNTVMGWWTDKEISTCTTPRTSKDSVYAHYNSWCKTNGLMPAGSTVFWRRLHYITAEQGVELVNVQETVTCTDPLTGRTEKSRIRKVNLDLDGLIMDSEAPTNVVPIQRVTPAKEPSDIPFVMVPPSDAEFVELDEPDLDGIATDVADHDEQPLLAPAPQTDGVLSPFVSDAPIVPVFTAQHPGSTITPIRNPAAKSGMGGAK
ncbi:phage/plasmid primase, P4 family [Acidithiobacillus thiooxidans]|uniref:phage/plasmid primase, P4 family n=1 Tax=Acidithiobacillus thiooxidans TaxID=930 RepID=UPI0028640879|nr:phage/plasmid primase, P4 family [Acidithiobacillus thiooxidans]MDR7927342.1 phage/plasmid primase, P4 family [Acidithiobacillus thiooxidans]